MKIGFVAVSGFSERADSAYNGGGKSVQFRWPGDGCGEAGVSKGMEAFGRASDRLPAARRRRADPPLPGGKGGGIEASLRGLSDRVWTNDNTSIIVSLFRSSDPLKTPVGQRHKHGED